MKEKPIRVLQILGALNIGGAETMIMNIYRNIDRKKIQFDFVVHSSDVGYYEKEIKDLGGMIYRVPKYKLYNHFQYKKAWRKLFEKHPEYRIIHSHVRSTASIILKIAKKYQLKTICHCHSTSNGKGIQAKTKNLFQKNISKYTDSKIACSVEAAQWLFNNKDVTDVHILYNGINVEKYAFSIEKRMFLRSKYNVDDNQILIGHVGRFVDVKNHDFLLSMMEKIILKNKNYRLMLIGDGELKEKIQKKTIEKNLSNYIIFVDPVLNIYDYYSAFDLFLFPSKYEGLGIVLVEAQFAGLNCIVSETIPNETIISNNVVRLPFDEKKWICEIMNICARLDRNKSIKLNEVSKKYNVKNTCNELCELYNELL